MALTIVSPLVDVATIEQMGSWQPSRTFLNTRRGIVIEQMTFAPGTAGAGTGVIYARANNLYFVDDTGTETLLNNAADVLVAVTADDTTPGYLGAKLVAGANIGLAVLGGTPGNQTLEVSFTGATGLSYFDEAEVAATYNYAQLIPSNAAANFNVVLSPKGTGYFSLIAPDGTGAGGNARGVQSVDLMLLRNDATQVASGPQSALIGGAYNKAGSACFVGGGSSVDLSGATRSAGFGIAVTASGTESFYAGDTITHSGISSWLGGEDIIGNNTDHSLLFGNAITINATSSDHNILLGDLITVNGGDAMVGTGYNIVLNGNYAHGYGKDLIVNGNASMAFGTDITINDNSCKAYGADITLTDNSCFAFGQGHVVNAGEGHYNFMFGGYHTASSLLGTSSWGTAIGVNARIESRWSIAFGTGYQTTTGDMGEQLQYGVGVTTDAITPVRIKPGNDASAYTWLPDDGAYAVTVKVLARRTDVDGENSYWICEALVTHEAGTVAIVGQTWTLQHQNGAAAGQPTPSLSADNTNNSVNVDVLGEAAKTIRWVAKIESLSNIG